MSPLSKSLSVIAAALWLGSLFLPALSFRFDSERDQLLMGYQVLTLGFMHLVVLEFSWLANVLFWWLIWCVWRKGLSTRAIHISAVAIVLLTLQSLEIFVWVRFFQYPVPYAGYFVWCGGNLLLALAALLRPGAPTGDGNGKPFSATPVGDA